MPRQLDPARDLLILKLNAFRDASIVCISRDMISVGLIDDATGRAGSRRNLRPRLEEIRANP